MQLLAASAMFNAGITAPGYPARFRKFRSRAGKFRAGVAVY